MTHILKINYRKIVWSTNHYIQPIEEARQTQICSLYWNMKLFLVKPKQNLNMKGVAEFQALEIPKKLCHTRNR